MSNIVISFDLESNNYSVPLKFETWLDDQCLYQSTVTQAQTLKFEIDDSDGEHELRLILKDKLPEHTVIDQQGAIVMDALLTVKNLRMDGVDPQQIFYALAEYRHDFNGTQEPTVDKFYGHMGCNGTVSLQFTTPFYLWLLEHM